MSFYFKNSVLQEYRNHNRQRIHYEKLRSHTWERSWDEGIP